MRHPQIRDHEVESVASALCSGKLVHTLFAAFGGDDHMAVPLQYGFERRENDRVVVDDQNSLPVAGRGSVRRAHSRDLSISGTWKRESYAGPGSGRAVNLNGPRMPDHHAVHHCKTQSGSTLALGGKERLQASLASGFIHTHARVDDFQRHALGF